MRPTATATFGACFLSSLLAGPLCALLLLAAGAAGPWLARLGYNSYQNAPFMAALVLLGGVPVGLLVGVVAGFPMLLVLSAFGLNTPLLAGLLGALLGAATGVWLAFPQQTAWEVLAALALVGGVCGVVANRLCALTSHSSGPPSAAAELQR
jgi:hypothetical protein